MRHPWRADSRGLLSIPFLLLTEELDPEQPEDCFSRVPVYMIRTTDFLWMAASFYSHFDYFCRTYLGVNLSLRQLAAYDVSFCRKTRFGNASSDRYRVFPIKIIQVEGVVTADIASVIEQWFYQPILLVEDHVDTETLEKRGSIIIRKSNVSSETLAGAVSKIVSVLKPNPTGTNLLPIEAMQDPSEYEIAAVNINLGDDSEHWATYLLMSHRYRGMWKIDSSPQGRKGSKSSSQLCREFDQMLAKEYIAAASLFEKINDASERRAAIIASRDLYTPAYFLGPTHEAISQRPPVARNGIIFDLPCINRALFEQRLERKVTNRVVEHFYRPWTSHNPPEPSERLPATELSDFQLLSSTWNAAERFMRACLALEANAQQAAVISVPKVGSSLFRLYRNVRQALLGKIHVSDVRFKRGATITDGKRFNLELENFGDTLASSIPAETLQYLSEVKTSIRVVSDLPVEWLRIGGVPLNARVKVSRIPRSPGNGFLLYLSQSRERLYLGKKQAEATVIINCLDQSDELYKYPKMLSANLSALGVPIKYFEVDSFLAYQKVLNDLEPFLLVHVGHGHYDSASGQCALLFGKELANIYQFQEQIAIPEIVLFGACETAPGNTDDSPGRGYLSFGSRSVLASILQIQADLTMEVYHSIIVEVWAIVISSKPVEKSWENIVQLALCKARAHDFLYGFRDLQLRSGRPVPSTELISAFQNAWNERFSREPSFDPMESWLLTPKLLEDAFIRYAPQEAVRFRKFIDEKQALPNSMFYTNLGFPESITVTSEGAR